MASRCGSTRSSTVWSAATTPPCSSCAAHPPPCPGGAGTLTGRVIDEGLATTALNLLSRRSYAGLAGLEFLYLLAGTGDLCLQKTLAERALAGLPPTTSFASPAAAPSTADTRLHDLHVVTTTHRPAAGLYRWPTAWTAARTTAGAGAWRTPHRASRRPEACASLPTCLV